MEDLRKAFLPPTFNEAHLLLVLEPIMMDNGPQ